MSEAEILMLESAGLAAIVIIFIGACVAAASSVFDVDE